LIKLLIADDSAFMRKALSLIVEKDSEIKVIGLARNGEEAVAKVRSLNPDVLTLDIEMPVLNGLDALRIIMEENPLPVLIISSLTKEGSRETLKALELGAVDYIPKNLSYVSLDILKLEDEIIQKVKLIAHKKNLIKSRARKKQDVVIRPVASGYRGNYKIIAIGASTGGPGALQDVITLFPHNLPCSVLVAQHMPAGFTRTFAERLDSLSQVKVKEAENGENLQNGIIYIAPGNQNMYLSKKGARVSITTSPKDMGTLYKPSVDILISSVAEIYGRLAIGVILTGMGNDGLVGMRKLKEKKGHVIAQDEATSIIYGMPKAVIEERLADRISPLKEIVNYILGIL